jgi:hypothetical protein
MSLAPTFPVEVLNPTQVPRPNCPDTPSIIIELLLRFCGLRQDQVRRANIRKKLPATTEPQVSVKLLSALPFSNVLRTGSETDPVTKVTTFYEYSTVQAREMFSIHVLEQNSAGGYGAIELSNEILAAFGSVEAEQAADKYSLKFSRLPASFVDASLPEGTTEVTHLAATYLVIRGYFYRKPAKYFNKFGVPPAPILIDP